MTALMRILIFTVALFVFVLFIRLASASSLTNGTVQLTVLDPANISNTTSNESASVESLISSARNHYPPSASQPIPKIIEPPQKNNEERDISEPKKPAEMIPTFQNVSPTYIRVEIEKHRIAIIVCLLLVILWLCVFIFILNRRITKKS